MCLSTTLYQQYEGYYCQNLFSKKGYFRLARALAGSKEFDAAQEQLAKALNLAPEDKAIQKEVQVIKLAEKKYLQAEKKKFSKMFG